MHRELYVLPTCPTQRDRSQFRTGSFWDPALGAYGYRYVRQTAGALVECAGLPALVVYATTQRAAATVEATSLYHTNAYEGGLEELGYPQDIVFAPDHPEADELGLVYRNGAELNLDELSRWALASLDAIQGALTNVVDERPIWVYTSRIMAAYLAASVVYDASADLSAEHLNFGQDSLYPWSVFSFESGTLCLPSLEEQPTAAAIA